MSKHIIVAHVYDKRGRLLSKAANSYTKSHSIQAHFARLANMPERIYLHAEIAALLKAGDTAYRLTVERYNKAGEPVLSRPCPICSLAISAWGIKKVEHT